MIFLILLTTKKHSHTPSQYREIVRLIKAGNYTKLDDLTAAAHELSEPYYKALALLEIAGLTELEPDQVKELALEGLECVSFVEQLWRRGELIGILVKKVNKWDANIESKKQVREELREHLLKLIVDMPNGKGLSDAISKSASKLGDDRFLILLKKSLTNTGFEVENSKDVIRHWVKNSDAFDRSYNEILSMISKLKEPYLRARLMGYIFIHCKRLERKKDCLKTLELAIESALKLGQKHRLETLQYLAKAGSSKEEFDSVLKMIEEIKSEERIRLLATLGGSADKAGLKNEAVDYFKTGLLLSYEIPDASNRVNLTLKLGKGIERCGELEYAKKTYKNAFNYVGDSDQFKFKIQKSIEKLESKRSYDDDISSKESQSGQKFSFEFDKCQMAVENHILALYDTYVGGLKPVHIRTIARAAPLCTAFDLDLAIIGFPAKDLKTLFNQVIKDTNIGLGGIYLEDLIKAGRVHFVTCTTDELPKNWEQLGLPVATTAHPNTDKKVSLKTVLEIAKKKHKLHRACFIMGLGKKGLPERLLKDVEHHLELTGKNIDLETCTAMGVLVQQIMMLN